MDINYIKSVAFDEEYTYKGTDLGCTYMPNKTILKVWSPVAEKMECHILRLDDEKHEIEEKHEMVLTEKGVWSLELTGDYELASYVYHVTIDGETKVATDPYALASTPNHERTVIVDMSKTKIDGNKATLLPLESYTDAIIYELHVRDFSSDEHGGMKNKGKFLALTEEGTVTQKGFPSGVDYLKDLGVTHIQLLPVYDYGSVDELNVEKSYNWGYDPVQYNTPEGSYCSDVNNPYGRIIELKKAIASLHSRGFRVIMDVVYNHMFDRMQSAFETLVPTYYFRCNADGEVSNGSFCGNDVASERPMMRQFLLQSTRLWIEEYGFDGFRFDLMGILDVETMNSIYQQTKAIDPSAMIYGEGWNMPTWLPEEDKATMMNHEQLPGIGFFSDLFREAVKGGTLDDKFEEKGYGSQGVEKSPEMMHLLYGTVKSISHDQGTIDKYFNHPEQTVNYIECHDNHTVWDKLEIVLSEESEETRRRRQQFMTKLVLLSQGIPFIHAGQEFYRTKGGDHNSYKSSEWINRFDWSRKDTFREDIQVIKSYIDLRKKESLFRLPTAELVAEHCQVEMMENHCIKYTLTNKEHQFVVLINPNVEKSILPIDKSVKWSLGEVSIQNEEAHIEPLEVAVLSIV